MEEKELIGKWISHYGKKYKVLSVLKRFESCPVELIKVEREGKTFFLSLNTDGTFFNPKKTFVCDAG